MTRSIGLILTLLLTGIAFCQNPDTTKKFRLGVQIGFLQQINIDDNESNHIYYRAELNLSYFDRPNRLVQTGVEYYRTYFYNSGYGGQPGYGISEENHIFRFDKFCVPICFNALLKNKFILGGGPSIDIFTVTKHTYNTITYDNTSLYKNVSSKTEHTSSINPFNLSAILKSEYIYRIKNLNFVIGARLKVGISRLMFYGFKGYTVFIYRDTNASINLGLLF